MRTRYTYHILTHLDENKATGPDLIPAKILKRIAKFIAAPLTRLCRRLFDESCWPTCWKYHIICPLYKKGAVYNSGNYRGIHLTSILSKVAEKVIGRKLVTYLQHDKFGLNQWAFQPGLSSKDLVTMLMMSWILAACKGYKLGAYLSDISGAFDRVFKPYILGKLHAAGVGDKYLTQFP